MGLASVVGFTDPRDDDELGVLQRHDVSEAIVRIRSAGIDVDDGTTTQLTSAHAHSLGAAIDSETRDLASDHGDLAQADVDLLRSIAAQHCPADEVALALHSVDALGPDGILLPVRLTAARDLRALDGLGSTRDLADVLQLLRHTDSREFLDDALEPLQSAVADSVERVLPLFIQ